VVEGARLESFGPRLSQPANFKRSICRSQLITGFQLAKIRLTTFSEFCEF
jgi:hypothetical protein